MVALQWGVQWLADIPTSPLTSVVHLKRGSTSSSKVTEESNLASYIHKGWTRTATGKQNNKSFKNGQKTTQKHQPNIYRGKGR